MADKYSFDVKDEWFSENDDISSWCKTLNIKLSEHNLCLGAMDIESDSYVLFICENNKFNLMVNLSRDLERRIDSAENM
ncbi:hypothetical protein HZY83_08045 [Gemella sp. GH3]|nr:MULTISPECIES: DUF6630 family protein [unclassified Gemella]MBF0714621.1 hypothetical protein [Gemella sp. GH3.1]NYS51573.1 hypothetical protein [Gemella sp. GH3]